MATKKKALSGYVVMGDDIPMGIYDTWAKALRFAREWRKRDYPEKMHIWFCNGGRHWMVAWEKNGVMVPDEWTLPDIIAKYEGK